MPNFESQFADKPDDLLTMKDEAWGGARTRQKRLEEVRKFSNGLALMSEEQARDMNRKEIVNHLTFYSKLQSQVSMLQSVVTGTKNLVEVVVDTNDPEKDLVDGAHMSTAVNRGAINHRGRFANFWKKCVGEILIAGGLPTMMPPRYGWLPEASVDAFFPPETDLDAELVPYCFVPKEYSYAELKDLLNSVEEGGGQFIYKENVEALIEQLKENVRQGTKTSSNFGSEVTRAAREDDRSNRSVAAQEAWEYYEVKTNEETGEDYVSKTIFATSTQSQQAPGLRNTEKENSSAVIIISYIEKAYEDAFEWMKFVTVDSEVGGIKNTDTLRGLAELMYPSARDQEDFLNLAMEGDKIRARPKIRLTENANADAVAKWDIEEDLYAPAGVEEMEFRSSSQHLLTPFSLLDSVGASLAGGSTAGGRDPRGEKLPDVKNRISLGSEVRTVRFNEAVNCLENVLEMVVWRLLRGKIKKGTNGYWETKWVRQYLEDNGVDYEKLSERENGRFKWIRIRVNRGISTGDRQDQIETAELLMNNIQQYPPANRPLILRDFTLAVTGDPDKAELLASAPRPILNQQRVIAENEWDTIARRAASGQLVSVQPDDIHQLHIPTHLVDMQALVARHDIRPWTMEDAVVFAAVTEHVSEHLEILIGNPATNFEGNQYLQAFQQVVRDAQPLVTEVQEQQEGGGGLSPEQEAKYQIEAEKLRIRGIELGLKQGELANLQQIRAEREQSVKAQQQLRERQQYANEVNTSRKLQLEERKIEQKASQPPKTS